MALSKLSNRIKRIKGKYYDTGTKNSSFLQVASDLKRLGIKHFYFMLEIYDYTLVDVDPYSPNLTREQISRIMTECTRNIWYYLREICRIPSQGGVPVRFKANRGNIAQIWCLVRGIDSWLCLPRQQGKTESILAAYTWAYSFGTNNSTFIFVNKDGGNAKANLQRVKDQIDCLPEYLRFEQILEEDADTGKVKIVKAVKNATTMKHPITKNQIVVKSKATSYESALSLARGLTAPFLHFDEPEFTNHIKTIIENSVSTFETASRNAKQNGAMYGRHFSCTPGDLDTSMGQEAAEILAKTAKWTEKLYDDYYEKGQEYLEQYAKCNDGGNGIVYIEYSYKQLGLTEEWFINISNKIDNPLTVKREILLQRLRGSSDSPFDQNDVEYITSTIKPVIDELYVLEHFRFDIYEELVKQIPYLVAIDCSTGTNSDNNAITIINPYTVKPVAEFKCPYIGETLLEKLIIELVRKHLPRAIVIIERNSVGDGIIDHLLHSPIRGNLYFDKNRDYVASNMQENETVTSMLKKQGEEKKYYGVYTGRQSREDMMAILFRHVSEFKDNFVTKNIIEDLSRLVRTKSGKIEAGPGFHDDSIMSYLIGLYVYYHGNNLPMFGFIKGSNEIENQNEGLRTIDDIEYEGIIPQHDVEIMRRQEAVRKEHDYQELMRQALLESQKESMILTRSGLVKNNVIDNTPSELLDDYYDYGDMDIDFFDELNNF